jgi:hypothetical protein
VVPPKVEICSHTSNTSLSGPPPSHISKSPMPRSRKAKAGVGSDSDSHSIAPPVPTDSPPRQNRDSSLPASSSPDRPLGPLSIVVPPEEREVVRVNNANLTELKNACDDALKRVRTLLPLHLLFLYVSSCIL